MEGWSRWMSEIMVSRVRSDGGRRGCCKREFSHQVEDNHEGGTHDNRYYPGYRFDRKGS